MRPSRINTAIDAFLVGMLFEYLLRVEVSFFPVALIILFSISLILDFVLDYYNKKKAKLEQQIVVNTEAINMASETIGLPKGWYVHEAGQDLLHMQWYMTVVNFDDIVDQENQTPRHVSIEDAPSYEEALKEIISRIKLGKIKNNS